MSLTKDQQKLIEDMKFQQNQVAFKEQISLLEQIKAKQVIKSNKSFVSLDKIFETFAIF